MTSFVPYGTLTFCKNCGEQNPYHRELTDEKILNLCPPNHSEMMNESYTIEFARAIESYLKGEK